jgi:hypothetical protein
MESGRKRSQAELFQPATARAERVCPKLRQGFGSRLFLTQEKMAKIAFA